MRVEKITDKECICISILFIMGTTLILGTGGKAKNDAWLAGLVGILLSLPVIFIYSRIQVIFPGKDLFQILELIFGRIFGKAVSLIYIWYAFHLGALVLRNFGEFVKTVAMPETPMFFPMLCMTLLCIAIVRLGIEEIGRFSAYLLPVLLIIIIIVQFFALTVFKLENLKPFLDGGLMPIMEGGFSSFAFPFAETVLFLGITFSLKTRKSPYKVYFVSILLAGLIIVVLTIRNIGVLGQMTSMLYFPAHAAVSRINIMDFVQRMELTVVIIFIIGAYVKSTVCLYVAARGIANIFQLKDYRSIVTQMGILMLYLAYIIYSNIMQMRYWALNVYQYYAFPMQVIFPIIIWIFVEAKGKKLKMERADINPPLNQ